MTGVYGLKVWQCAIFQALVKYGEQKPMDSTFRPAVICLN